jgi:hypothetical protein
MDPLFSVDSLLIGVNATASSSAKSNVGFLVDLGESREEGLAGVVVEVAGHSVVLLSDGNNGAHVFRLNEASFVVHGGLGAETGHVAVLFFARLVRVLLSLDGEVVLVNVARSETPVSFLALSEFDLLRFGATEPVLAPGSAAAEVVPVSVTVDGRGKDDTPENPTHFADHPSVGLAHIVHNMEHHVVY